MATGINAEGVAVDFAGIAAAVFTQTLRHNKPMFYVSHSLSAFILLASFRVAAGAPELPGDLQAGKLLYASDMAKAADLDGWVMEGPGRT